MKVLDVWKRERACASTQASPASTTRAGLEYVVDKPLTISRNAARRFLVSAFALDGFQTLADVPTAISRLEFVQEDSINVCGRIHDLVLWSRVRDYAPDMLHRALYESPRAAFEYYFPNLCALPVDDYPHFLRAMRARAENPGRWHGLLPEEEPVAHRLLSTMDTTGPLRTRSTGSEDGYTTSGWGTRTTVAARVIEKLWLQGRLVVSHRANFERWFDRTERILPHVATLEPPHPDDERQFLVRKRLRARRLFRLKKADADALGHATFRAVEIEDVRRPWYILAEDAAELSSFEDAADPPAADVLLLAPLDPLIYDRERNRDIWGFDYTWEVYTPVAKRRWGYYVLPILLGDRLVGRMDPKMDRSAKTLTIHSLTVEPNITWAEVAPALAARLAAYARFLGAVRIDLPETTPKLFRRRLEKYIG